MLKYILVFIVFLNFALIAENKTKLENMMFKETPLDYVAWMLSKYWDKHIVVKEKARDIKVSLNLDNINCEDALKAICHSNGLWYQEDPENNFIYIETLEEYSDSSQLGKAKFIEVITVVYPHANDLARTLDNLFHNQIFYIEPDKSIGDDSANIDDALGRLTKMTKLSTVIENNFDGGNGSSISNISNQQSLNSTAIKAIEKENNKRKIAINGKSKKLQPGIVYMTTIKKTNTILLRSSDKDSIDEVKEIIAKLDKPQSQVLLEVKVLSLDITDEKRRNIDISYHSDNLKSQSVFNRNSANYPYQDANGNGIDYALGLLGINGGSLQDSRAFVFQNISKNIEARIELLDTEGKIEKIATPNLMVTDLEASRIFVGEEITIVTDVDEEEEEEDDHNGNKTTKTIVDLETEQRNVGSSLVITPKIHADKTVTIRITHEESSEKVGGREITYKGQVYFLGTDIKKQIITSTVIAKSGQMIALGGLITKQKIENKTSIPLLCDLPLIGTLFEKTSNDIINQELIILVRPFVMLTPSDAEGISKSFIDRVSEHNAVKDDILFNKDLTPQDESKMNKRGKALSARIKIKELPSSILEMEVE